MKDETSTWLAYADENHDVVEINGRKFSEGLLESFLNEIEDNAFEVLGHERLNKTSKPSLH